jgi:uncharacterized protein YdiU (UPF0061 family)
MRELSNLDSKPIDAVMDLFIDRDAAKVWLDLYLERCDEEVDSNGTAVSTTVRCKQMRQHNPKYILRNYLAQIAIEKAEQGDFSEVEVLAELLKTPFDEQSDKNAYANLPPEWGKEMEISCSS